MEFNIYIIKHPDLDECGEFKTEVYLQKALKLK